MIGYPTQSHIILTLRQLVQVQLNSIYSYYSYCFYFYYYYFSYPYYYEHALTVCVKLDLQRWTCMDSLYTLKCLVHTKLAYDGRLCL